MGANYEVFVIQVENAEFVKQNCREFLVAHHRKVTHERNLGEIAIVDCNAVLFSPLSGKYLQVVADRSICRVDDRAWFGENPFASYLSRSGRVYHFWSIDSGFVAGYSIFCDERIVERDWALFDRSRKGVDSERSALQFSPIVGDELSLAMGTKMTWSEMVGQHESLEVGLAHVVARFGFKVHLLDFYDVVDDKYGVAVHGNDYSQQPLVSWTALLFEVNEKL